MKKEYKKSLKSLRKYDEKFHKFLKSHLKSKKLPEIMIDEIYRLDALTKRLNLCVWALREIILDKKIASKKEIDDTIDNLLIKEFKKN